eukprot:TRINITY_DN7330_c0_g1_i2.p1 TRINITY_DN7330_c0_g1~~TRINITY_DN7330_c0_g1_i2.p1  ORF type:complete len:176 (-),score=44.12 TRINITY_DN7330_c0_g1_i2:69-596(-)
MRIREEKSLPPLEELGVLNSNGFKKIVKVKQNHKILAMKIYDANSTKSEEKLNHILEEFRLTNELRNSALILEYKDFFFYNNKLHELVEYCNGGTLSNYISDLIKSKKIITKDQILLIATNIATGIKDLIDKKVCPKTVSYTHLRAHETSLHLVCRLLLEKKKKKVIKDKTNIMK